MRAFELFSHLETSKLEEMWRILLSEESDDNAQDIDKENLVSLLDMLYEELSTKDSQKVAAQPKAYSSSEVLDILLTIFEDFFVTTVNFEVRMVDIEKSTRL